MKNNKQVPKDVLLHQILQEIEDEDKALNGDGYLDEIIPMPKTELSKIREIQKIRQWFFILLIMGSIVYFLFDTESTSDEEQKSKQPPVTIPKDNKIVKTDVKNKTITPGPKQIIETVPILLKHSDNIKKPEIKQLITHPTQTAREKAIEALRLQLDN